MAYELYYFSGRGRAEQIRLLLHEADQPFTEVRVARDNLAELKAKGPGTLPFGAVPVLHHDGLVLAQGAAIMGSLGRRHGLAPSEPGAAARTDAMCLGAEDLRSKYFGLFGDGAEAEQAEFVETLWRARWLPNLEGLLALSGDTGFFVGAALSYGDIAIWDTFDAVLRYVKGATLDGFPGLARFYAAILERPRIARHVAGRKD
jgi:glutathione S-transferase